MKALGFLSNYISNQWNLIRNIGFREGLPVHVEKKLEVTNIITFTATLLCFPISIMMAVNGYFLAALIILLSNGFILLTYYFNERGKYNSARLWLVIVANISIFPHGLIYGQVSGISLLYFTLCCTPFIIFELEMKKHIFISALISIILFFVLLFVHEFKLVVVLSSPVEFFIPMLSLAVLMHISNIYYFIQVNRNADIILEELKERAEMEIDNAQNVICASKLIENKDSIASVLQNQINELECSKSELKESNEKLTRINNRMDNFIYTTSHDLKSPFANIEALLEVIKVNSSYKNEEVKEIVDMMSLSVNKFKDTVWNLTKIDQFNENQSIYSDLVKMDEMAEELKLSLQYQIKDTNATIEYDFRNAPSLVFSKKNMRSILLNMVGNGIKYRDPKRSPIIKISTEIEAPYFIVRIEDNGLGIPESSKSKIFSLFHRAHNHVEGSGVGLYIVNRIIENNEGKIEVESKEEMGTIFRIYINVKQ